MQQSDYEAGEDLKNKGNVHFKKGEYKAALKCYSHVFSYIGMNGEVQLPGIPSIDKSDKKIAGAASSLRVKTFQNIMIIYSKQGNTEKVIEKANKILDLTASLDPEDPLNKQRTKALFFRAQMHRKNTDFEQCEKDLHEAESLCKDEKLKKNIEDERKRLKQAIELEEKRFMRRMRKGMKKKKAKDKAAEKMEVSAAAKQIEVEETPESGDKDEVADAEMDEVAEDVTTATPI